MPLDFRRYHVAQLTSVSPGVENTYRKARELLEDYGVDLADLAEMLENADD